MNSKIFTLTAVFLFFILKVNAQDIYTTADNVVDIKLSVTDDNLSHKFELATKEKHFVSNGTNIIYRIHLDYQSDKDKTSYFGIQHKAERSSTRQNDPQVPGITAPVLIPPVKKKKAFAVNEPEEFPFSIQGQNTLENTTYEVEVYLVKYLSKSDYDNNTHNYSTLSNVIFEVNVGLHAASSQNTSNPISLSAYPNPSTDHINFVYTHAQNQNTFSQNMPLAVTIFNDEGVQVNQYNLSSSSTTANSISYTLDTSHLQEGTYYFQLLHNGTNQVRIILIE